MRCATCGTENVQDSRFCGGCGAKIASSRVAPTAKLSDDAVFPTAQPAQPRSGPYSAQQQAYVPTPAPGSLPPAYGAPQGYLPTPAPGAMMRPSQPQVSYSPPQASAQRSAMPSPAGMSQADSPSMSIGSARRGSPALIAAVVILDLGLAAAGAMLLVKGLEKPAAGEKKSEPAPAPAPAPAAPPKSSAAETAPAPAAPAAPAVDAITEAQAAATPAASAAVAATNAVAAAKSDPRHHTSSSKSNAKTKPEGAAAGSAPLDPYAAQPVTNPTPEVAPAPAATGPDLARDVDRKAAASRGVFDLCKTNAGEAHGTVQVAFQVLADGRVAHVAAVENSTGNAQLASCLVNTISAWQFEPRTGAAANFVRPFRFD